MAASSSPPATVPSIFSPALELIPTLRSSSGGGNEILTVPFLNLCRLSITVLERFGTAMAIVRSDIGGNITRLDTAYQTDPKEFEELYNIIRADVAAGTMTGSYSNTNGLLWLTRAMDFLVCMLDNLRNNPEFSVFEAASIAYSTMLSCYHGWIARQAFSMALRLCPDRETFFEKLGGGDIDGDMARFISEFRTILKSNHEFLKSVGADKITAS